MKKVLSVLLTVLMIGQAFLMCVNAAEPEEPLEKVPSELEDGKLYQLLSNDLKPFYYFSKSQADLTFTLTNDLDPADSLAKTLKIQLTGASGRGEIAGTNPVQTKTFTCTLPSDAEIMAGESAAISLTGGFTGATNTVVTVTYDVLTGIPTGEKNEDGTDKLEWKPIAKSLEARFYTTFSNPDTDEFTEWTTLSGSYRAAGGYKNYYITDPAKLADIEFRFTNTTDSDVTIVGYAANSTAGVLALSFVELNTEEKTIPAGGTVTYKPLVLNGYTGSDEQLAAAFTSVGYKKYTQTIGVTVKNAGTNLSTMATVIIYKDYGLNDLFAREVKAQRQASDYTDPDAFAAYLAAMKASAVLVNGKKNSNQFVGTTAFGVAYKYPDQAAALENAVKALEATAKHKHSFSSEWSSDETAHWHACTAEDCDIEDYATCGLEGAAYAAHVYDQEVVADRYLKSEAIYTRGGIYYKSCKCGACDKSENAATFTDYENRSLSECYRYEVTETGSRIGRQGKINENGYTSTTVGRTIIPLTAEQLEKIGDTATVIFSDGTNDYTITVDSVYTYFYDVNGGEETLYTAENEGCAAFIIIDNNGSGGAISGYGYFRVYNGSVDETNFLFDALIAPRKPL